MSGRDKFTTLEQSKRNTKVAQNQKPKERF